MLLELYNDLSGDNLDTLHEFHVNYSFLPVEPTSFIEKHILSKLHKQVANDIAIQQGREYDGFGKTSATQVCATALNIQNPSCLMGFQPAILTVRQTWQNLTN